MGADVLAEARSCSSAFCVPDFSIDLDQCSLAQRFILDNTEYDGQMGASVDRPFRACMLLEPIAQLGRVPSTHRIEDKDMGKKVCGT